MIDRSAYAGASGTLPFEFISAASGTAGGLHLATTNTAFHVPPSFLR